MQKLFTAFFTPFFCLIFSSSLFAQEHEQVAFLDESVNHTIAFYKEALTEHLFVYQGVEYKPILLHEGHPFFEVNDWQSGFVYYAGIWYDDVLLQYDLINDNLIIRHYNGFTKVILEGERVGYFKINNSFFERFKAEEAGNLPPGYYQQLYTGKIKVYAKRKKIYKEEIDKDRTSVKRKVIPRNSYYIWKDGSYHTVRNKGTVLGVLEDKKREMKKYMKENNLKYRKNPDLVLKKIASFYDEVTQRL